MTNQQKLVVSIQLGKEEQEVGELISAGKNIYFKYYTRFLERGIEISPFKLKLSEEIYVGDALPFEGLFGVFADSQPDGWGRLLLDRTLTSRGISFHEITPLDRLSFVGSYGMGALKYRPASEQEFHKGPRFELDAIAEAMQIVLQGISYEMIEELYSLGGSSGGARPKILVGYNSTNDHLLHGTDELPDGYEHWIIKFPAASDRQDIANIEYAYYKMALQAGIEMNESRLFTGLSGRNYFGTKRFDRQGNKRIHLHSAAGLMHDNFRLSNLDYGHIMDCAFRLEKSVLAYEKVLRLAAFNVFMHNRDDHSKNVSFLMDEKGEWKFSPAYDLTFSSSSHGMHSTMVLGESKNPGTKQLLELGEYFKVKNTKLILEEVKDTVRFWKKLAVECGVEKDSLAIVDRELSLKR
jgi:serine/threonine-protein kinase HipA